MLKDRTYLKQPGWVALIAALAAGIGTHLFGLVSVLHNHDDLFVQPAGFGTGVESGRWFLEVLGRLNRMLFGDYNLPWVNGVLFLVALAIGAGLLVSVLQLKSRTAAVVIGALVVVFPSVTAIMFYRFTAIYYGVAAMLAVLAAWVLERYKKCGLLLSVLCIALSMGIYQAFVPFTISIFVLLMIRKGLQGGTNIWKLVLRGVYYCVDLILGLVLYFLLLQLSLYVFDASLGSYQGIDKMGQLALDQIPGLVKTAVKYFVMLPTNNYCALAPTGLLKWSYLLLELLSGGMIVYILFTRVKKLDTVLGTILLVALFPLAANFIVIMAPPSGINTMTVYSFVVALCAPFVLLEALPPMEGPCLKGAKTVVSRAVAAVTAAIVISYAYLANVNYTGLYYANRQAENYMNSIVVQVRMTEGFDAEKSWAIFGKIQDPLLSGQWQNIPFYGGYTSTEGLIRAYSRYSWFFLHTGYNIPLASGEMMEELSGSQEVKDMPCWPTEGSIRVIGDAVVFKFEEISS